MRHPLFLTIACTFALAIGFALYSAIPATEDWWANALANDE